MGDGKIKAWLVEWFGDGVIDFLRVVKPWLKGLIAAFIGGGATAITTWMGMTAAREMGFDVPVLHWDAIKIVFLSGAITNVAFYLKKSPLPEKGQDYSPVKVARPPNEEESFRRGKKLLKRDDKVVM